MSNGDGRESSQPNGTLNMANASSRDNKRRKVNGMCEMVSTDGLSRSRVLFSIMMMMMIVIDLNCYNFCVFAC